MFEVQPVRSKELQSQIAALLGCEFYPDTYAFFAGEQMCIRDRNQDGNIRVIAEGYCRAEVVKLKRDKGYITADVLSKTLTAETGVLDIRSEALINESLSTLEEVLQFHPTISGDYMTTASSISNPGLLADFIASSVFVRYQDKAAVLEMFDPLKRLEKTIVLMESEMKLLRTEMDIQRKVKEAIDCLLYTSTSTCTPTLSCPKRAEKKW